MGQPTLTGFVIGLVVLSAIAGILGLFLTQTALVYNVEYDNTTIAKFNRLSDTSLQTQRIKNETEKISEKEGLIDVIGGYFSSAYRTIVVTKQSFDIYDDMKDEAFEEARLGDVGRILSTTLSTIVILLIFLGIIVSVIVYKNKKV